MISGILIRIKIISGIWIRIKKWDLGQNQNDRWDLDQNKKMGSGSESKRLGSATMIAIFLKFSKAQLLLWNNISSRQSTVDYAMRDIFTFDII